MSKSLSVAVVGCGRMGGIHALHLKERDDVELVGVVDPDAARGRAVGGALFSSVEELLGGFPGLDAAVVASPTALHSAHARALVEAGVRVLLEKPLTDSLEQDASFSDWLSSHHPHATMLAFQRRFDAPLARAWELLREGAIGRPFKFVSVLEDSRPMPAGYESPGLLQDMSIHNVDELLWLAGEVPVEVRAVGHRIFSQHDAAVVEDFDDASMEFSFESGALGQIFVSRNHVSGYRVETWIYGEAGVIHVGGFHQQQHEVVLEAYGSTESIEVRHFQLRDYGPGRPEFLDRFGDAYAQELDHFISACRSGEPFSVGHREASRASGVLRAATEAIQTDRVVSLDPELFSD